MYNPAFFTALFLSTDTWEIVGDELLQKIPPPTSAILYVIIRLFILGKDLK